MEYPLTRVFWLMTRDLDGRSAAAALKARVSVERAVDLVRESCGRVPTELASLRKRVRVATAAPLDARGLKAIEASFARWVEAVGAGAVSALQGASVGVRACRRLGQQVRAGYALWWDYSSDGKRWWVQMEVDNETDKGYLLDLSGEVWVTDLVRPRPDRFMPRDEKRGGRQLGWGGSSADFMPARPFTTASQRVGLGVFGFVETTSEGTVYGVRPEVFLRHAGYSCSLPVPRLN